MPGVTYMINCSGSGYSNKNSQLLASLNPRVSVLSILEVLTFNKLEKEPHYPHFTDEGTEAEKGPVKYRGHTLSCGHPTPAV